MKNGLRKLGNRIFMRNRNTYLVRVIKNHDISGGTINTGIGAKLTFLNLYWSYSVSIDDI